MTWNVQLLCYVCHALGLRVAAYHVLWSASGAFYETTAGAHCALSRVGSVTVCLFGFLWGQRSEIKGRRLLARHPTRCKRVGTVLGGK